MPRHGSNKLIYRHRGATFCPEDLERCRNPAGSSVLCQESDPLEESWFGPPLPSADATLRSFLRSFSLPGWKKATLSFYCRRQRSARRRRRRSRSSAAAAHQTKSAVVMLLILLCLVTRHSDGDGRCRRRRRRREGEGVLGRRTAWSSGTGWQGEVAQSIREHLFWPV